MSSQKTFSLTEDLSSGDSDSDFCSIINPLNSAETEQLLPVTMEELCEVGGKGKDRNIFGRRKKSEKRPLLLDVKNDELGVCGCMQGEIYVGVRYIKKKHTPRSEHLVI
jgi:hypothetical protein